MPVLILRQLQPWRENLGKRQVKSPKVYFRDTGFPHALLDIEAVPLWALLPPM